MSHAFTVRCDKSKLPTAAQLNDAIADLGFDIRICDFAWTESGFLPTSLAGRGTGFELFVDDEPGCGCQVSFVMHSSPYEAAVAAAASSSLADVTDGELSYEGDTMPIEVVLADARNIYTECVCCIARLESGDRGLPWNQPALSTFETEESRRAVLENAPDIEAVDPSGNAYCLRDGRRADHLQWLSVELSD